MWFRARRVTDKRAARRARLFAFGALVVLVGAAYLVYSVLYELPELKKTMQHLTRSGRPRPYRTKSTLKDAQGNKRRAPGMALNPPQSARKMHAEKKRDTLRDQRQAERAHEAEKRADALDAARAQLEAEPPRGGGGAGGG